MGSGPLVLLDTHVLLWLDAGDERLGARARRAADAALGQDRLCVSAISFWEIAMLETRDRVRLGQPLATWRRELQDAGLIELAVDGEIGITAASLKKLHGDPADRIIAATASLHSATLLTADERLLAWTGKARLRDARR